MTKPSQTVRMTIENLDNEFKSLMETNVIDCGIYINQRIVTKFEIKG
jgi:hypothetical protein